MYSVFFVGTAGSGKSTLVGAMKQYMLDLGIDCCAVNLDPGADKLPYEPEIDIREIVSAWEVMENYELGPNGALLVASDIAALNIGEIKKEIDDYNPEFALMDTCGQIELFAFRSSGQIIFQNLRGDCPIMVYLYDPALAKTPSGFATLLMLSVIVKYRFGAPIVNVLTKRDVLSEDDVNRIVEWAQDPELLAGALQEDSTKMVRDLNIRLLQAVYEDLASSGNLVPVSAYTGSGLEHLYGVIEEVIQYHYSSS